MIYRKVIFASSTVYYGDFLGLDAADKECKLLAAAAELPNDEAFIAWLSTPDQPMSQRIEHLPVKYVRSDGAPIADGWDDLVDGTILSPIRKDELGEDATDMVTIAWTGTSSDGEAHESHCKAWTSGGLFSDGLTGWLTATDYQWSERAVDQCGIEAHLYCIET